MNNTEENDELLFDEILKSEQNFFDDEISEEDLFDERVFEDDNPIVEPKKDKLTKEEKLKIIEERKKQKEEKIRALKEAKLKELKEQRRAEKIQALKEQKLLELKEQKRKEKEAKLEKLKQQQERAERKQTVEQNNKQGNNSNLTSDNSKNIEKNKMEKKQKDRIKKLRSQLNKEDIKNMDKPYEDDENFDDIFNNEAELVDIFDEGNYEAEQVEEKQPQKEIESKIENKKAGKKEKNKEKKSKKNKKDKLQQQENADIYEEVKNKQEKREKNVVVRALKAMFVTAWYLLLLLVIILAIRAVAYKQTDVMGYRVHLVLSGSMEPTIDAGDIVISKPVKDSEEIKEGDVIAFKEDGMDVIHRVTKVYTNYDGTHLYRTQGDNNNTEDRGLLSNDKVIGKFAFRVKNMAKAVLWVQNNIVIVLIFLVGLTIMCILIRRLIDGKRKAN